MLNMFIKRVKTLFALNAISTSKKDMYISHHMKLFHSKEPPPTYNCMHPNSLHNHVSNTHQKIKE